MSIDAHPSHGEKVRKDLNVYRCQLSQGEKVHRTLMSIDPRDGLSPHALYTVERGPVPRHRRTHRKRSSTHYIEKSPTKTLFTAPP